jgi:hypothetical protein
MENMEKKNGKCYVKYGKGIRKSKTRKRKWKMK